MGSVGDGGSRFLLCAFADVGAATRGCGGRLCGDARGAAIRAGPAAQPRDHRRAARADGTRRGVCRVHVDAADAGAVRSAVSVAAGRGVAAVGVPGAGRADDIGVRQAAVRAEGFQDV